MKQADKAKSQEMFERWGEQYSELTNNLDSNGIIHQSCNIVNSKIEEITEKECDTYSTTLSVTRMGDFYEFLGDDAIAAAETPRLIFTKRDGKHMAGIPICFIWTK